MTAARHDGDEAWPRRYLLGEVALRLVLVVVASTLLPKVFTGDIGHFRNIADCIASPSNHMIAACHKKGLAAGHLGHGFNLPYRSVLFEFPPLPLLSLLLRPLSLGNLVAFRIIFGIVFGAFELLSLDRLRRAWPDQARGLTLAWSAAVLPVAVLAWFRFDFLAVLFATLGLVALEQGRKVTWQVVAGWLTKLWPAVLLVGLAERRRWRDAAEGAIAVGVATVLWWAWSPKGFSKFLQYRAGKGLEIESLFASFRLLGHHGRARVVSGAWVIDRGGFTWVNGAVTVALVLFAALCLLRAWRPGADVVALCGALTLASMLFSRILSAQYVVWVAPFVVVLAVRGRPRVGWLYAVAGWLTFAYLCAFDNALTKANRLLGGVVLARNLVLVALLVDMFLAIRPPDGDEPAPHSAAREQVFDQR